MDARESGLARLNAPRLELSDVYYLHLRSLFAELHKAAVHAHGRLLDVGCGNRPYGELFAARVDAYVGCDIVQSSDARVNVLCHATELPFGEGSCDTVLVTQVIEHVADHRTLLAEAFRVLRPGGVLILSGPMYWPLHEEPFDFFRFTRHGLRYLLAGVGFDGIEIVENGGKWALSGQALIHALQGTSLGRPVVVRTLNRIFAYLDDRHPDRGNPINYVAVGRKRAPAPLPAGRA